jgi:hypothetical protein
MTDIFTETNRCFAHSATLADGSPAPLGAWEPLDAHLREVSETAGGFAESFGAREWAELAGLWHDLGKYSKEFQAYLRSVGGPPILIAKMSRPLVGEWITQQQELNTAGSNSLLGRCSRTQSRVITLGYPTESNCGSASKKTSLSGNLLPQLI